MNKIIFKKKHLFIICLINFLYCKKEINNFQVLKKHEKYIIKDNLNDLLKENNININNKITDVMFIQNSSLIYPFSFSNSFFSTIINIMFKKRINNGYTNITYFYHIKPSNKTSLLLNFCKIIGIFPFLSNVIIILIQYKFKNFYKTLYQKKIFFIILILIFISIFLQILMINYFNKNRVNKIDYKNFFFQLKYFFTYIFFIILNIIQNLISIDFDINIILSLFLFFCYIYNIFINIKNLLLIPYYDFIYKIYTQNIKHTLKKYIIVEPLAVVPINYNIQFLENDIYDIDKFVYLSEESLFKKNVLLKNIDNGIIE